jgi:hypothetical protein
MPQDRAPPLQRLFERSGLQNVARDLDWRVYDLALTLVRKLPEEGEHTAKEGRTRPRGTASATIGDDRILGQYDPSLTRWHLLRRGQSLD